MTPSKAFPVHVEQTPDGDYVLTWTEDFSDAAVRVRAHTTPEEAAQGEPVAEAAHPGVRIGGLGGGPRYYFHLQPASGEGLTAAQRDVPLEAGTNFRDLGGYRGAEGRRVRWGRLFRSGHMARLSERDRAIVAALDIRVCCDFRRAEEHRSEPSRLPESTRIVGVTVTPGSSTSFYEQLADGNARPADMAAFMEEINREFVRHHSAPFRRMLQELLALEAGAFMINCAAGKDRTGFGAALILAALGVSEQDIVADYLLSDRYYPIERELQRVKRKYSPPGAPEFETGLMLPMMQTRREYIEAALEAIRRDYGTLDRFLEEAMGVGPAERRELRERFTTG